MEESSTFPFLLQLKLTLIFFLILHLANLHFCNHFQAKKNLNCFKGTRTIQEAKANLLKI